MQVTDSHFWVQEGLRVARELGDEIAWFRGLIEEVFKAPDEQLSPTSQSVMAKLGSNLDSVREVVRRLDMVLQQNDFQGEPTPIESGEVWSLGTYDLHFNQRAIYNGYLEPVLRRRIVDRLPDRVIAFLIAIAGDVDLLQREKGGGVGWHYHYLNKWKQRSDVLLAWDTRADVAHDKRGIFSEKHAERGKAFAARPAGWKDLKRQTIHNACKRDLDKWHVSEFRNASNGADVVWPRTAVLTPRNEPRSRA